MTAAMWLPAASLCQREIVRFLRQRSRVVSAFATPLLFWFILGSGAGTSFHPPGAPEGMAYLEYFFPGTVLMIVLFTAIFATISVIDDRTSGFLQAVLVAPVPRTSIVAGKVAGGALLALLHALPFLALARIAGVPLTWTAAAAAVPLLLLIGCGLTGLGFMLAWRMESVQGFHAIMNLGLLPLWFLSGAVFPASGAAWWVQVLMYLNPLGYGLGALRQVLYLGTEVPGGGGPGLAVNLFVTTVAAVGICAAAVRQARRPRAGGML